MLFFKKKKEPAVTGEVVDLCFQMRLEPCARTSYVDAYYYDIYLHGTGKRIGECDLRLGMNQDLYYAGQIGYRINEPYRGHGYAYEACRMLLDIAHREHGYQEVWITCSPENTASRKIIEKLHFELVEVAVVPKNHWLYRRGETIKNIYRIKL